MFVSLIKELNLTLQNFSEPCWNENLVAGICQKDNVEFFLQLQYINFISVLFKEHHICSSAVVPCYATWE